MSGPLIQLRRSIPGAALFAAALAVASSLYALKILAAWAVTTESQLVVLCLVARREGTTPEDLADEMRKKPWVGEVRVVPPEEVGSYVAEAVREVGTTVGLSAAELSAAIEVTGRGSVCRPTAFVEWLGALRKHPAFERVFFDENGRRRAAEVYRRARQIIVVWLVVAWLGAIVSGVGAIGRRPGQTSAPLPALGGSLDLGRKSPGMWQKGAASVGRVLLPPVVAWFCLYVILLFWPLPFMGSLGANTHASVLAATVALVEAACWLAALAGRFLSR